MKLPDGPLSNLVLDRYATGELSEEQARAVETRLDARARRHLEAVDAVRAQLPPVDVADLRARAARQAPAEVVELRPQGARWRSWAVVAPLLLAAALAVLAVLPGRVPHGGDGGVAAVRLRGGEALEVFRAEGGELVPYVAGTPVGEGDVLGFRVRPGGHGTVVVLSVDGYGVVSPFFPDRGDEGVPLAGEAVVALNGTVTLDNAPGPEVFVAVFDRAVQEAVRAARDAFSEGGHAGLVTWAEEAPHADAVEVTRR